MWRDLEVARMGDGQWVVAREAPASPDPVRESDPQRVLFLRRELPASPLGRVYDVDSDTFGALWVPPPETPLPPPPTPGLSPLAFMTRFTEAEQVAIEIAKDTAPDAQVRAALRVIERTVLIASDVKVDDPRTVLGVERLVQFGLLTPARAQEILAP